MAETLRFCSGCGRPLRAGVRFCEACGRPVPGQPAVPPPPPVAQPASLPPSPAPYAPKSRGSMTGKVIVILIGLLVVVYGTRGPLLDVVGASALATVTSVSPGDEDGYDIAYTFVAGGREVSGEINKDTLNVAELPQVGSAIPVRYLKALPGVSLPASGGSPLGSVGVVVFGLVLIFLGLKFSWSASLTSGGDD